VKRTGTITPWGLSPPQWLLLLNDRGRENWGTVNGSARNARNSFPFPEFPARFIFPFYPVSAHFFLSMRSRLDCRRPLWRGEPWGRVVRNWVKTENNRKHGNNSLH